MLNLIKNITIVSLFNLFNLFNSQYIGVPGLQTDGHGCVLDGGYEWCESTQMCQRPWETNCLDNSITEIPKNCITWYDGCNTCSAHNGELQGCTLMMCFTTNEPYCQSFTSGELNVGEICYRFCEDGSQNTISREDDCMDGTKCGGRLTSTSMISFDSCGKNSHTCNIVSH